MNAFQPAHCGLIFTEDHIRKARANKDDLPFNPAWALLNTLDGQTELDSLLIAGLRYRLRADIPAGESGASRLLSMAWPLLIEAEDGIESTLAQYRAHFVLCQAFELLRENPILENPVNWLADFRQQTAQLPPPSAEDAISQLWHAVAGVASGIVLEDADLYHAGIAVFRQVIDEEIHPEGHFRTAIKVDPEAQSLHNQLLGAQALVLIAEMSACAGVDSDRHLWHYESRGVSAITAATYPLYYYFYPAEWRWNGSEYRPSAGVTIAEAKALFRQHAGFLELLPSRYEKPLKAVQMVLKELRPVYDARGGGLTTLTHATPEPKRRRRRWLF